MPATGTRLRTAALGLAAAAVFLVSWVLRYNDPEGSFGGVTDDHFFYLVQGWQLLYGELPDRDFFDPGAPLTYALTAALQVLLGRSIWSEYVFCVLILSAGAAATCVLAARASGSILLGLLAAVFEIALRPRLYNYPKIAIYALAIAVLWWWIGNPRTKRTWAVAAVTAFAFLMRHDHGLYVAATFGLILLVMRPIAWRERLRHTVIYGTATLLLLTPYLVFLQANGGVIEHFASGARYSARDYERTPLEFPVPSFEPLFAEDGGESKEWWDAAPFAALERHYTTWWTYWLFITLPFAALLLLWRGRAQPSSAWDADAYRVAALAVLTIILNARLIRGNLDGRFADVAVPIAILAIWTLAATFRLRGGARIVAVTVALVAAVVTAGILVRPAMQLVRNSSVLEGFAAAERDAALVTRLVERTWPLEMWTDDRRGQIGLAKYLAACTAPTDRVLMTPFFPPVFGLAQRGFAGGRWDMRGGFFDTPAEQQLTVERLQRQSVPIVIGPPATGADEFRREFPIVADYLQREYRSAGDADLGDGLTFALLVHRGAVRTGTYEPLALPCFR